MPSTKKLLQAAAGSAGGDPLYVEDVFSTYLYEGNASGQGANAQSITNNIDLSGEGGLTWIKNRDSGGSNAWSHYLFDTERGAAKYIRSNLTNAEAASNNSLSAFNSDGFTLGETGGTNNNGDSYASWTFRKAEKFFDVLTYIGDGNATHEIAHNLGSVPGCIIIKNTSDATNWLVYHKDIVNDLMLNTTNGGLLQIINSVTSTSFNFSNSSLVNTSGSTYVAYLFASDAGGFGDDSDENIIKCGSYTGTGGAGTPPVINLGFEPQWLLVKNASADGNWMLMDTMRGWGADGSNSGPKELRPNTNEAEFDWGQYNYDLWTVNPTGFTVGPTDLFNVNNTTGATYIYMAIRRPMKTPESGTEVLSTVAYTGTGADKFLTSSSVVDLAFNKKRTSGDWTWTGRLQGAGRKLVSNGDFPEGTDPNGIKGLDYNNGVLLGTNGDINGNGDTYISYMLSRATGAFDVVAYTGNGTAGTAQAHNLGVVPEMMIGKNRSNSSNWMVYHTGATYTAGAGLKLNTTAAGVSNTYDFGDSSGGAQRPDASSVYLGGNVNSTNDNYIIYLFATLDGVSKVGSYTGTGSDLNVDCGFSAGARFVMIKRTDASSDWFIWDSVRGIVSGDDPYVRWNVSSAEVTNTDYIDPLSSGFTVTSSAPAALNASGGNYIFLAIA